MEKPEGAGIEAPRPLTREGRVPLGKQGGPAEKAETAVMSESGATVRVLSEAGFPLKVVTVELDSGGIVRVLLDGSGGVAEPMGGVVRIGAPGHLWSAYKSGTREVRLHPETLLIVRGQACMEHLVEASICPELADYPFFAEQIGRCVSFGRIDEDQWGLAVDADLYQGAVFGELTLQLQWDTEEVLSIAHDLAVAHGGRYVYDMGDVRFETAERRALLLDVADPASVRGEPFALRMEARPSKGESLRRSYAYGLLILQESSYERQWTSTLPSRIEGLIPGRAYEVVASGSRTGMYGRRWFRFTGQDSLVLKLAGPVRVSVRLVPEGPMPLPPSCRLTWRVSRTSEGFVFGDNSWTGRKEHTPIIGTGRVEFDLPDEKTALRGGGPAPSQGGRARFPMPGEVDLEVDASGFERAHLALHLPAGATECDGGTLRLVARAPQIVLSDPGPMLERVTGYGDDVTVIDDKTERQIYFGVASEKVLPDGSGMVFLQSAEGKKALFEANWEEGGDEPHEWLPRSHAFVLRQDDRNLGFLRNDDGTFRCVASDHEFDVLVGDWRPGEDILFGWTWEGIDVTLAQVRAGILAQDPRMEFIAPRGGASFWWSWVDEAGNVGPREELSLACRKGELNLGR